jgi:hypothetical protein
MDTAAQKTAATRTETAELFSSDAWQSALFELAAAK